MPETLTLTTPDGDLPATLWLPPAGRGPGLLLLQEIFGVSRYIRSRAEDLAALGYVVLAPHLYWRIGRDTIEGEDALDDAFAAVQELPWEGAVRDGVTAFEALQQRPEVSGGTGVVGFCYGGGLGYQVAGLTGADALVSYYGSALAQLVDVLPPVTAPSLHHFGLADQYLPPDVVAHLTEVLERQDATTVVTYEGADHAFDNPDFHLHHEGASRQAWATTTEWLAKTLPV
jgi:carboxymethylenebutenolidase